MRTGKGRKGEEKRDRMGRGQTDAARTEREAQRQARRGNRQIMILTYGICVIFFCMMAYLVYFMVARSQTVINNSYNKRQEALAKKVQRGDIVSADGKVLATTQTDEDGNDTRVYPYGEMFCHVVGRTQNSMTGIELSQCYPLLTSHANPLKKLLNTLQGEKNPGDTVVTTLQYELQKVACEALGERKGAVVAIEPSTGKILAMVSNPAYDPNTVAEDWDELIADENDDSALLNRAAQGLYPPGSTFKVVTAMEYLMENEDTYQDFSYTCSGSDSYSGNAVSCYGNESHGTVGLKTALAKSCNTAFAKIGTTLNVTSFQKLAKKLLFNTSLSVDFEYNQSQFSLEKDADDGELTQTAIGQGKTLVTPLENAMIAAMIANDGEMMTPYVVDHVENEAGQVVTSYAPESAGQSVDAWVAKKLNKMMQAVVSEGTASALSNLSYTVAGKTGSAEADSEGTTHAWFIGFAPADDPQIAISVIVEGAGTGSRYAVPIAQEMLEAYLGD